MNWTERKEKYKQRNLIGGKFKALRTLEENLPNLDTRVRGLSIHQHWDGTIAGTLVLDGGETVYEYTYNVIDDYLTEKGLIIDPDEPTEDGVDDYDDHQELRYYLVRELPTDKDYSCTKDWEGDWSKPVGFITENCTSHFRNIVCKREKKERASTMPMTCLKEDELLTNSPVENAE